MQNFIYSGSKTKEISFPLGGIGSGSIGLAGNGRFIDWEIFNKPNKGSINGASHFSVKAESNGKLIDARVLNGDIQSSYIGQYMKAHFQGYGFGPSIETMAGFPHFKNTEFVGEFPIANMTFRDEHFPGDVKLLAFNPFIPTDEDDSSIPGAFFEVEFYNDKEYAIDYTACLSIKNPLNKLTKNLYVQDDCIKKIYLFSNEYLEDDINYGEMCIASDSEHISYQEYWYRGGWFDTLNKFWRNFASEGALENRSYSDVGTGDIASLAVHLSLNPGEKKSARFIVTWNFPNNYNYWNPLKQSDGQKDVTWKNYYAVLFKNAKESASYSLKNWDRLYNETKKFKDALFTSTLPHEVLDAVSSNLSVLKSPTVLRLEDGSFYGWEGVHELAGSCEGSCTHVWNYAYALPFLFPKLERSMRNLDFKYNQRENGEMCFRIQLPIGRDQLIFRACADGQFGGIIKSYRDWKISGDDEFLKNNWPYIKKSLEYAWADTNLDKWDPNKEGILSGRQHHTLDVELFGSNSWLEGYYLAALKAGAEIAQYFGESETAGEYLNLFNKGKEWSDKNLFNGEYYQQLIDIQDKSILEGFLGTDGYWDSESEQIKYQIADGCEIDQVSAQWHANLCGLGEIFDKQQVKSALQSLYKYNFKQSMREFYNPCRIFCLNDEGGLVICSWPNSQTKPVIPLTYAEETMTGFEYQAASHMIQEGLVEEGLSIVKAIRDRYDGEKRNPWNEFECGSNYARSMASYSLLLSYSGFEYDIPNKMIGFNPINRENGCFKCFWSLDSGWGTFEMRPNTTEITVLYGELNIDKLKLPYLNGTNINSVKYEDETDFSVKDDCLYFKDILNIKSNRSITILY